MRVHNTALSTVLYDTSDECHINAVLGSIIQPLLQSCRLGGQSGAPDGDTAIFMLNNVSAVQNILRFAAKQSDSGRVATMSWIEQLDTEAETWISVLVREEVGRTLRRSDLDKLLELMEALPVDLVASQQPGLDADRVGTVLRAFYSSLFSAVAPHFERLQDPEFRYYFGENMSDTQMMIRELIYVQTLQAFY